MRNLSLTRQCLGLVTRIECSIRPLAGDNGMWTLLFAAGMAGEQPSAIKAAVQNYKEKHSVPAEAVAG